MKRLTLLMSLICVAILSGCDKEVSTTPHPEMAHLAKSSESCSKGVGYCVGCGYHIGDGYKCGVGLMIDCPGSRETLVNAVPTEHKYESGKVVWADDNKLIKTIGECR